MQNKFHITTFKKSRLLNLLSETIDKRRYHNLYLTSCYISLDSAKKIIVDINKIVLLSEVYIYIDRKSAIAIGGNKLTSFCNSFKNVKVTLYSVETKHLFHSKAYALISFDENEEIYCGSLVIGSANLTGLGLTKKNGNIECLLDSQDDSLLQEFLNQLDKIQIVEVSDIEKFSKAEEYSFIYALLQEGAFIHKWTDNLGQYFTIRYKLNKNGKGKVGDPDLELMGFNIETATISKRYFIFDYVPSHLVDSENLTRNYGIETYLGFWLPNDALETLFDKKGFKGFKARIFKALDEQLNEIKTQILKDLEYLKNEDFIESVDSDPVKLFERKIDELKDNDLKLKNIFSKYEIFELPYDLRRKDEIEELFHEMVTLCESRKKNLTMKAFLNAYSLFSLDVFRNGLDQEII